jgi:hypothetical protein
VCSWPDLACPLHSEVSTVDKSFYYCAVINDWIFAIEDFFSFYLVRHGLNKPTWKPNFGLCGCFRRAASLSPLGPQVSGPACGRIPNCNLSTYGVLKNENPSHTQQQPPICVNIRVIILSSPFKAIPFAQSHLLPNGECTSSFAPCIVVQYDRTHFVLY